MSKKETEFERFARMKRLEKEAEIKKEKELEENSFQKKKKNNKSLSNLDSKLYINNLNFDEEEFFYNFY